MMVYRRFNNGTFDNNNLLSHFGDLILWEF